MKQFLSFFRSKLGSVAIFIAFFAVMGLFFSLYNLPMKALVYPVILCVIIGLAYLAYQYYVYLQINQEITELKNTAAELIDSTMLSHTLPDDEYRQLIESLVKQKRMVLDDASEETARMMEYYTLWVHQIKTPIASMKLQLQNEDSELSRNLLSELGRIERYVEMVLSYLRLEGSGNDFVIRECDLDSVIQEAVKKFSGDFIMRKIRLNYEPVNKQVLTDEKWLSFVIEQVISNALKYTDKGEISIYVDDPLTLCIRDTGMGISPEDLPRIFERSFTGVTGRIDKKASGLGLYLCRRICLKLNHEISAESQIGNGTTIRINLDTRRSIIE